MESAVWEFEMLRIRVLREQYVNGDMDTPTLRMRLELLGYVEPYLTQEVQHCEELKQR